MPKKHKSAFEEESAKIEEGLSWSEIARRVVYTSLGSAAMASRVVKEGKLHKEVIGGLLVKAEKRKDEIMEILAREVSKFLGKINVSEEISKALKGMVINLNASIDFQEKGKGKGVSPRTTVREIKIDKSDPSDE